jgi:hypothetical protein
MSDILKHILSHKYIYNNRNVRCTCSFTSKKEGNLMDSADQRDRVVVSSMLVT